MEFDKSTKEMSKHLDFNLTAEQQSSIEDWLREDIREWAPQEELALRSYVLSLVDGDDARLKANALRVFRNFCEIQMMLGSHHSQQAFADVIPANSALPEVLSHVKHGTEEPNVYNLAFAVSKHSALPAQLATFAQSIARARLRMEEINNEL